MKYLPLFLLAILAGCPLAAPTSDADVDVAVATDAVVDAADAVDAVDAAEAVEAAPVRDRYEPCVPGDACESGTDCLPVTATYPGSTSDVSYRCSTACTHSQTCPRARTNLNGVCLDDECYANCGTDADCPTGLRCFPQSPTTVMRCVP